MPDSSEGEPFETVCGRETATPISISTLRTRKKAAWTKAAVVTPATEAPGMLVRKMPIIAAVPAWAGAIALIAVPPCDAPQAVLNVSPPFGYAARRMLRQVSPMNADSQVFSASARTIQ